MCEEEPCGEVPVKRNQKPEPTRSQHVMELDPPVLVRPPQLTLHGAETSYCQPALPTLLFSAIKFCGALLYNKRLLEQIVEPKWGVAVTKAQHTWYWLWAWAERSIKGHKGNAEEAVVKA